MAQAPHPEFRQEFDRDPELLYLNSGTHSLTPRTVLDAVQRYQREYERNPTLQLFKAWGRLWSAQKRLATFLNARPQDLFLRVNVTEVMNAFVLGMPLRPGSEIVIGDLEYGAIQNLARFRAERDGLKLRTIHLPTTPEEIAGVTAESLVSGILEQLSPETSLLILSDVMTSNGLTLPLPELARETRKRGVLLAIDGAHGPGFLPVDLGRLDDVDFYGGNLHKWMLGAKGTAFGWLPERHQTVIRPLHAGWTTFETGPFFTEFGGGSRFQGAFLLNGCHDFAPYFAIVDTIDFWDRLGREKIRDRIVALQTVVEDEMRRQLPDWKLASPPLGPRRGPLVAYTLPARLAGREPQLMREMIERHHVQVHIVPVQKTWRLRLSPHIYLSEDEITRGVKALASL